MSCRKNTFAPSIFGDIEDWDNFFRPMFYRGYLDKHTKSGLSLYEDEHHVYVEASVPGLKPEQVDVSYENGVLWIRGENKEEKKDVKVHMRSSQSFSYQLPIPQHVDTSQTPEATLENGILKVTFKKQKASQSHKIEVKRK